MVKKEEIKNPEDMLKQEGHKSDCAVNNKPAEKAGSCDCGFEMPQESETGDQPARIDTGNEPREDESKIIIPEEGPKDVRLVTLVVGVSSLAIPVENSDTAGMIAIINKIRSGVKPASSDGYMKGDYLDITYFAAGKEHDDVALVDPRTINAILIGAAGSAEKKQIATPKLVSVPRGGRSRRH